MYSTSIIAVVRSEEKAKVEIWELGEDRKVEEIEIEGENVRSVRVRMQEIIIAS